MAVNQYIRDSNSPNDHKKGNRTNSKRNTNKITSYSKQYSEDISAYKEYAKKRRDNRSVRQEDAANYYDRLFDYINDCQTSEEPITRAGMLLALGVDRMTYYRMRDYEYDWRLYEYLDMNDLDCEDISSNECVFTDENENLCLMEGDKKILLIPFSELIQKAELMHESQTEARLYKSGRVGDIFALKSLHGWQEDNQPSIVNQTLIIGETEAREAINALERARLTE